MAAYWELKYGLTSSALCITGTGYGSILIIHFVKKGNKRQLCCVCN